jgi:hypothetical protein
MDTKTATHASSILYKGSNVFCSFSPFFFQHTLQKREEEQEKGTQPALLVTKIQR